MPQTGKIGRISRKAVALEKKYDWGKAANLHEQALSLVGERDFSKAGEAQERIAYCLYRGAFQAETQEEFKSRMLEAVEAYEKAAKVYEKVEHAKGLHCEANALFADSWIHIDASRRKKALDDCGKLLKEAIKAFEQAGDHLGHGKACNDLLFCLDACNELEWDWTETKRRLEEAIEYGQNAISALSKVGDERELTRAYYRMGAYSILAGHGYLGEEKREEFTQMALSYAERALKLSKKTGDAFLISRSNLIAASIQIDLTGNLELSTKYAEEGLQQAKKIRDSFLIAWAFEALAEAIFGTMTIEQDPDKKREGYEKAIRHAEDALRHFLVVCSYDNLSGVYSLLSESYYYLALDVETDPGERRNLLERAIEVGQKALKYAEEAGSPVIFAVRHSLSKALYSLSKMETQITEKRRLLEEASEHRQKSIAISEQITPPFLYWSRGVAQNYIALIKAEFARIETDKAEKKRLLEEAVSHMERCIELCTKTIPIHPEARTFAVLGWYYSWFGGILNELYSLTGEKEVLERAVQVHQSTAEVYRKAKLPSRVAETYWRKARLYDQLGERTKAGSNFQSASENYRLAAEKIPQLKEFYMDHATYMQAWSEIEKARNHHSQRQYGQAREHYEKAADLHRSTERWDYLSLNYLAWAKLEEAENQSRREQAREAFETFREAANLFCKAKTSIKAELKNVKDGDERKMAAELIKASDLRHQYCQGRIALEEAKILDRQGDNMASSKKYGSATETFQKIVDSIEDESDRQELEPIVYLCRAWQTMTRAEAEASPDMYAEASKLFEEAKDHSVNEKAKLLALAHSCFCKALEAGTKFEITRDMAMYLTTKKHVEAATSYYLKAGFQTASEYAKATYRLFDAYMFTYKAQTETDPRKRAQFYQMAERFLQASAGSYMKAKHPEKSEEVQRLYESVKEERQLAMSLTELLHAPLIASTTASFSTPNPINEKAVGLERFEHAHIQANLFIQLTEVKVGENVALEIELVNAGKEPATLVKVDDIVPAGFNIIEKPEMFRVEDSYLNMKGKRLDPLKTEDLKIVAKPQSKGTFNIKPRILYLDETGKYKHHEPEPVTITVKELGIRGWIKGER